MWTVCHVPGCWSKSPDPNITFHRFTNSNKKRWCSAIKIPCLPDMGAYYVCSRHFYTNQISRYSSRTILDKTATPSLHIPIAPISLPILIEDDISVDNSTPKDRSYNSSTETEDDSSDSTSSTDTANEASLEILVKPTTSTTIIKPVIMLKQCRTCTGKFLEEETKHLDDTIRICNDSITVHKILCASVKIINDSQLPKNICNRCIDKACASYIFIQMVFKSQKVLYSKYVSKTSHIDFPIIKSNVKLRNKDIGNDEMKNNVTLDQNKCRLSNVNNNKKIGSIYDGEILTLTEKVNIDETFINSSLEDRVIFYSRLEDPLQEEATIFLKEESSMIPSDESTMIHSIVITDIKKESLNDENATIVQEIRNEDIVENSNMDSFTAINNENDKKIIEHDHIYSCVEVELKQEVTEYANDDSNVVTDSEIPQKTNNSLKNILVKSSLGNELKSSDQVNNYPCADCIISFDDKKSYKQHRVAKHRSVSESEDSDEGFLKYQCPHCPTYYYNKISLQSHLVRNHDRPKNGKATKYQCLTCSRFYCNNSSYLSHIKRKHKYGLSEGKNKYKCPYCDASFKFERSYTLHIMKKHKSLFEAEDDKSENKRFQCPVCPSFYFHKNSLIEHVMKKHNSYYEKTRYNKIGDRYHCKLCSNNFYNKFNYQSHIRKYHKTRDSNKVGKKIDYSSNETSNYLNRCIE